ncbi:MAG TPA: hypoxanthine phosphoribosyltransferase [Fimbriimonadales bacterium]|nr:hypoxanthine phosphoribosyltransferase [Fimbriimonadales bacterium]
MDVEPFLAEEEIAARLAELAAEIRGAYGDSRPLLVGILKGSFVFLADLGRELGPEYPVDFMAVASYDGASSSGAPEIRLDLRTEIRGRDVLIVEDIVDSGNTLRYLLQALREREPRSIRVVTLLFKPASFQGSERPAFIGFEIPPDFVVGYGMDLDEKWRNLKHIGKLIQNKTDS